MTVHNYKSRQVHNTLNGLNTSSGFRDLHSTKSGPNLCQIWQVFGPWAIRYQANGQVTMRVHNCRPRQFHRTSNRENPSSSYRDMVWQSPARTVMTIPRLRGKNAGNGILNFKLRYSNSLWNTAQIPRGIHSDSWCEDWYFIRWHTEV